MECSQQFTNQIDTDQFIATADEVLDNTMNQEEPIRRDMGENHSPEHTSQGVGDFRVALFFKLVRNLPTQELDQLLQAVLNVARSIEVHTDSEHECAQKAAYVADAFIMAFQTRNCRGGKGERDLFYQLIARLAVEFPHTVASLMPLVPTFGTYKDWFFILQTARDEKTTPEEVRVAMKPTATMIMDLVRDQLLLDQRIMNAGSSQVSTDSSATSTLKISLLSKWAPREGKAMDALVKDLAKHVFPTSTCPKKDYRQLVAALNQAIHTTETQMSSNLWDDIRFGSVPSICMMRNRKAFLNEKVKGPQPTAAQMETGNRHPDDEKRVSCRKRLAAMLLDERCSKIKGRQLFPHEIAMKFDGYECNISSMEQLLFQKQWNDIRNSVIQSLKEKNTLLQDTPSKVMSLGKLLPVVDVSGSMHGIPMEVAIALGILISELAAPAFAHRMITFSESPSWVVLSPDMTISDKVFTVRQAPWGYNTDFEKVMELVLTVAKEGNLTPEQIPDLLVLSDMQFDQARGVDVDFTQQHQQVDRWETQHERIVRRFKETGIEVCGREWPCPTITYWNLRGDTVGFPVQADTPGVNMLSGFSPSLMTAILQGDDIAGCEGAQDEETLEIVPEAQIAVGTRATKNPYDTLRGILDDASYDLVRTILKQSQEGVLKYYR